MSCVREPSPPAPVPGSTNSFSEHPWARPSRAITEERAASAPALVHLASICTEVTDELIGSRCSYPAPTEDEQRTLSTFSPYIRQICLRWYVGLTKNIEPELNLQSSIPPASAREAATCSSVEWREMKKQDFLHSGEDTRAFMQLCFSRLISCSNVHSRRKERKPNFCER